MSRSLRPVPRQLPSFDLVVATVGRTGELARFFASLTAQDYSRARVLIVDQNDDERLEPVIAASPVEVVRLRSGLGLSRARNVALARIEADIVAFPDDDCVYPPGLLRRVGERLAATPELDGLTGRAVGFDGSASASWRTDEALLRRDDLWNRAISFTIFLRRGTVQAVGDFDVELGLGSGTPWHSGEEIDYLVRALDVGARVEYDPDIFVTHPGKHVSPSALRSLGNRDGASVGYILRKHAYSKRMVGRMLVRPIGGALVALARRDRGQAAFHLSTLRGRLLGYRS